MKVCILILAALCSFFPLVCTFAATPFYNGVPSGGYYSNGNFDSGATAKPDKVAVLRPTADGWQILSNRAV